MHGNLSPTIDTILRVLGPTPARAGLGGHHGPVLLVAAAAAGDRAVANRAHAHPAVAAGVGEPRRAAAGRFAGHGVLSCQSVHTPARRPGRGLGHALVFGYAVADEGHVRPAARQGHERPCHDALRLHAEPMDESWVPRAPCRGYVGRASAGLVPDAEIRDHRHHSELQLIAFA